MADEKKRLGRSLESLISAARGRELSMDVVSRSGHRVQGVAVENVAPNPFQPRREFAIEALNGLVESLRTHGLMQPIVVRQSGDSYEIVAGERRWRASRELGWDSIDAVVIEADDRRMLEWALVENIQREGLGPLELARAFRQLAQEFSLTQEAVARAVGMSRPAVANFIRLLELPQSVQERVSRGTVSVGAARALLALGSAAEQEAAAQEIEGGALNVHQVEEFVRERTPGRRRKVAATGKAAVDPNQRALAEELQELLGTKVSIQGSLKRGRLWIQFHSARELDRLVRRLRGEAPSLQEPDEQAEEPDSLTV